MSSADISFQLEGPEDTFKIVRDKRSHKISFANDLSNHDFTLEERLWACKGLNGDLEDDENWKLLNIDVSNRSAKSYFCDLFNFSYTTFMKWDQK
jgi:hypothetical protein